MTRPKDEMGSQIVSFESNISHPILVYVNRNNNFQAQARRFLAVTSPEPEFPVIFGFKWDPQTSAWRQGGASPERLTQLPTGVSPLQKRIWKWHFYHCSSCNFFFHICFCHLWCNFPFKEQDVLQSFKIPSFFFLKYYLCFPKAPPPALPNMKKFYTI